jgi:hypothetical protein
MLLPERGADGSISDEGLGAFAGLGFIPYI